MSVLGWVSKGSLPRGGSPKRSCTRGCEFFGDDDVLASDSEATHSHLEALRKQIQLELRESQRKFAADMERKLEQALNADFVETVSKQKKARSLPIQVVQERTQRDASPVPDRSQRSNEDALWTGMSLQDIAPLWGTGKEYSALEREEIEDTDPNTQREKWTARWLADMEDGELDIYTCLGLSNMFSLTPDTSRMLGKVLAVLCLQIVVPFCLLIDEIRLGVHMGPGAGRLDFRLIGFTLFGYAVFILYQGASDRCRTSLLNLMQNYKGIPTGYWLPLLAGEISNVFTCFVLIVALYSIFTTQKHSPELILNTIAVNFLAECDANFVDTSMKEAAVINFKEFTQKLWLSQEVSAEVHNPFVETRFGKVFRRTLYLIAATGALGSMSLLLLPRHFMEDTLPGGRTTTIPALP